MDAKSSGRALLMLSIAYGLVVGLLGAIGFDRVDLVAVVGAVVLGWHGGFVALAAVTAVAIVLDPGVAGAQRSTALTILGALTAWYGVTGDQCRITPRPTPPPR